MATLAQQAHNVLLAKIISCEYAPGASLNEALLINELGLTRMPLRDALRQLEVEGLLTIRPKKGIIISEIRAEDISQLSESLIMALSHVMTHYSYLLDKVYLQDIYHRMEKVWHVDPDAQDLEENMNMVNALCAELYSYWASITPNKVIRDFLAAVLKKKQRLLNAIGVHFTANYFYNYFQSPHDTLDVVRALLDHRIKEAVEYTSMTLRAESHCLLMVWINSRGSK